MSNVTEMTDASSAGPSAWERDLYAHLTSHVEGERALLQEYRAAAQTSPSKALGYLVNLLIDDEIRHHRIFTELAESLKNDALLRDKEPSIPYVDFDQTSNRDAVVDLTDQLLRREQADAQELKRLRRELRDVKDTSLWSLLVDVMERDTQKHIAILRFAKKQAGRKRR
jgi:rubrerythrin